MSDREALLAMVIDRKWEPTPRLVLADWLDEHGECGESMRWAAENGKEPIRDGYGRWYFTHNWSKRSYFYVPKSVFGLRYEWCGVQESVMRWAKVRDCWNAFIVAFGEAYRRGKIGRRRKIKCLSH